MSIDVISSPASPGCRVVWKSSPHLEVRSAYLQITGPSYALNQEAVLMVVGQKVYVLHLITMHPWEVTPSLGASGYDVVGVVDALF